MEVFVDNDLSINDVRLVGRLCDRKSPFFKIIVDVFNHVKPLLASEIPKTFGNYTIHDTNHSIRIMEYMYDLIEDVELLSDLELSILILSALLHDYGMVVSENEKELIRSNSYPDKSIKFSALLAIKEGNEYFAIQEFIRRIHAKRSNEKIQTEFKKYLDIPGQPHFNFSYELGQICQSHTEDYSWIRQNLLPDIQVKGSHNYNPRFCSYMLRLADILDIDHQRAPINLYRLINPKDISDNEWRQHFIINNYKKIVFSKDKSQKRIVFNGKSFDVNIHRKLLNYLGWVNTELNNSIAALKNQEPQYELNIDNRIEIQIETEGYKFSDEKLNINFKAITNLLMGEKIYGDKTLGLRELIQNSIDACLVRREIYNEQKKFEDEDYEPMIKIIIDKDKQLATVKDNGIGMTYEILKKYFLSIGVSYYSSEEFLLKGINYQPIGNFGIGFLACFMLADEVTIKTRHVNNLIKYTLNLFKEDEFVVWKEEEDITFFGTEVSLDLKSFLNVFNDNKDELEKFLSTYFITDAVRIELVEVETRSRINIFNSIHIINYSKPNSLKIDISNFLKETKGIVELVKAKPYINLVEDIDYRGTALYYDGNTLEEVDASITPIKKFISGSDILSFMEVAIIINEDEFSRALEVMDNFHDAIDKVKHSFEWVSIFGLPGSIPNIKNNVIDRRNDLLPNVSFDTLFNYGHSDFLDTVAYTQERYIHCNNLNQDFIEFLKGGGNMGFRTFLTQNVYLRDVLVKDFSFQPVNKAKIFGGEEFKIDLFSKNIIPTLSRNNFSTDIISKLNYSFTKAFHQAYLEEGSLNEKERHSLKEFIEKYFPKTSLLEK